MPTISFTTTYGTVYLVLLFFLALILLSYFMAKAKGQPDLTNKFTTGMLLFLWIIAGMILLSGGKFLRIP